MKPVSKSNFEAPFWYHPKFNKWKYTKTSSMILVKGDYKSRQNVKGFAVDIVRLLRQENISAVWALKIPHNSDRVMEEFSVIDILKDLISQLLRLNFSMHTEHLASLSCAQFRIAETLDDWLGLLTMMLDNVPSLYIVIDIEAVGVAFAKEACGFSWLTSFSNIMRKLDAKGAITQVKILLLSYGSASLQEPRLADFSELVVAIRQSTPSSAIKRGRHTRNLRPGARRLS